MAQLSASVSGPNARVAAGLLPERGRVLAAINLSDSVQQGLDTFFNFVPNLIAFLVILVVGYFIAKLLKGLATKGLQKLGLDRALHESDAGEWVERLSPGSSPSKGVGRLVFWLAFLFVLTAAIGALQIPAVTAFMNQVLAYLPNVIAAVVIFVLAAAIAGAAGAAAVKLMGDTPTGKLVGAIVPTLVMVIGVFMVLNQLKIAEEIVTITYLVLMGAIGLGMALAFGLGGRDVASRLLEDAYRKGQEQRGQVKRDVEIGKERGKEQAERGKERAQAEAGSDNAGGAQPAGGSYRA
jgi:small-conductance mechanosensitive channel